MVSSWSGTSGRLLASPSSRDTWCSRIQLTLPVRMSSGSMTPACLMCSSLTLLPWVLLQAWRGAVHKCMRSTLWKAMPGPRSSRDRNCGCQSRVPQTIFPLAFAPNAGVPCTEPSHLDKNLDLQSLVPQARPCSAQRTQWARSYPGRRSMVPASLNPTRRCRPHPRVAPLPAWKAQRRMSIKTRALRNARGHSWQYIYIYIWCSSMQHLGPWWFLIHSSSN